MRKEFNNLVETMKCWDLFQNDDEVAIALNELEQKIIEVEKRIECSVRSAQEANDSISLYTQKVDNNETFKMEVDDYDSILRGTNDVLIALDMKDTECIENNWYNLFGKDEETYPIVNCLDCGHPQPLLDENVHVDSMGRHMICEQCEGSFNIGGDVAPTMQCMESDNFDKVKQVIEILKSLDNGNGVDGETMEYILRKVGMEEQMLKQLIAQTTNDEIGYLLDVRNGKG